VHALALHLYTPAQWDEKNAAAPQSPNCAGKK
jgi:BolA protein